ncbi:MAG: pitrilysin family protein [Ruminococcus sp.]|nr:insulinase family protein [Ruminococcus sp.]MDO4418810.1 pitrilysin family protein [Ruminococcus sp.]
MQVKEYESLKLREKYYEIEHSSGLKIFVMPKEGYRSSYAIIGTPFGSINTEFELKDGKVRVPDGIAHYLEHKLFESEDGDAFTKYAETGANGNAYTSFDKTCYLFSCTEQFEKSLSILLELVTSPYFTEETVAKEQGIIGQEIKMYEDSPEWRVLFNLLGAMYHNHPVRVDIAGSIESIAEITPESLYTCYNSYYNFHNMALSVVGNVDVDEVVRICDKYLKEQEKTEVKSLFPEEPYEIKEAYAEQIFPVAVPIFNFGFKLKADKLHNEDQLAHLDILLFMLASSTSPMYRELMDKKLINSTFGYEFFEGGGYSALIFSGESRDPQKAAEIIKSYFDKAKAEGLDANDFNDAKKATYGDALSSLNSVDTVANMLEDFYFSKRKIFDYYDAIGNANIEKACELLNEIDTANSSLSVVKGE